MDDSLDKSMQVMRRRVLGIVKAKLMWPAICLGMLVFGSVVQMVDPHKPVPRDAALIELEMAEIGLARKEGRRANLDQFQPFDSSNLVNYVAPLLVVWVVCKFAGWRRRLPASILASLAGLWFAVSLLWPADNNPGSVVGIIMVALFLTPFWMWFSPRLFDRILKGPAQSGGEHSPMAEYSGIWVKLWLVVTIASIGSLVWWVNDSIDGGSIPGPFALGVRGLFVAWALWLVTGAQIGLAWPNPGVPREGPDIEPELVNDGFPLDG